MVEMTIGHVYRPMVRRSLLRWLLTLGLVAAAGNSSAPALTIRHDVPDSEYVALASELQFEAVGMILRPSVRCTGTLIHPEWVLTAAHCIPASTATVEFALGPSVADTRVSVPADQWFRHTGFNSTALQNGRDFGLIHLTQPILDVTPAQLYRGTNERGMLGYTVGFGRTGDGLTGEVSGTEGVRRAGTNMIDSFGAPVGGGIEIVLGDFDNPSNPADNTLGNSAPTERETMVALYDSGGGWFIEEGGTTFLAGVTSFRGGNDGTDTNSDYGDIWGAGRVTREQAWIDANANVARFWTLTQGSWNDVSGWDGGLVPEMVSTAVVRQGTVSTGASAAARFTIIESAGRLELNSNFIAESVIVRRGGDLAWGVSAPGAVQLTGQLDATDGSLTAVLWSDEASGSLGVQGRASIGGSLHLDYAPGFSGPAQAGQLQEYELLTATELVGTFDEVNGLPLTDQLTFVGQTPDGRNGWFQSIRYADNRVILGSYLAAMGDANLDGFVDVSDFNIWNVNRFSGGTSWTSGDFNGDGVTDVSDFNLWNVHRFTSANTLLVPEPIPGTWLLATGLLTLRRRQRTRRPLWVGSRATRPGA